MNAHVGEIVADLERHGQPPPPDLIDRLKSGAVTEAAFRDALGIRPVTPDGDAFGEFWKAVPGPAAYDVSNLARVRTYWRRDDDPRPCPAPQRVLRRRPGSGGAEVELAHGGRLAAVRVDRLLSQTLGPGWAVPPVPDPDPPGVAWRPVAGWPAYEVSRCGLVRSYHALGRRLAVDPQRLLRPLWDDNLARTFVQLSDGRGAHGKVLIEDLVTSAWGQPSAKAR